jgi:hypothetical protein
MHALTPFADCRGVVMSLTPERGRILAAYGQDRRGWDAPGSLANLRMVAHLDEDEIALAWVRFCADAKVKTPGAFPNLAGPHWRERIHAAGDLTPRQVPAAERCNDCGKPEAHVLHPSDHPYECIRRTEGNPTAEIAHLRTLIRATESATEPIEGDADE